MRVTSPHFYQLSKGKFMKKTVIALSAIALVATTVASAALITSSNKSKEFERAARLENLSMIAVKNGDFALACRAQRQVADALVKAHARGGDLYGEVSKNNQEFCTKAGV
jgi:hypothetical protein